MIFLTETKCKICFIHVGFNCKRKKWGKKKSGNYVHLKFPFWLFAPLPYHVRLQMSCLTKWLLTFWASVAHHSTVDDHMRFQTCSLTKRLIDLLHGTQLYALSLHLCIFRLCARPNNVLHSEQVCVCEWACAFSKLTKWLLALDTIVRRDLSCLATRIEEILGGFIATSRDQNWQSLV